MWCWSTLRCCCSRPGAIGRVCLWSKATSGEFRRKPLWIGGQPMQPSGTVPPRVHMPLPIPGAFEAADRGPIAHETLPSALLVRSGQAMPRTARSIPASGQHWGPGLTSRSPRQASLANESSQTCQGVVSCVQEHEASRGSATHLPLALEQVWTASASQIEPQIEDSGFACVRTMTRRS